MGILKDPHGSTIGFTDRPGESTHQCGPACRLHDPCCPPYRDGMFGGPYRVETHALDCKRGHSW
jgi:hypothetical protein